MGFYSKAGLVAATQNNHSEEDIKKDAKIILNTVAVNGLYKGYLLLSSESAGNELNAGIFKDNP